MRRPVLVGLIAAGLLLNSLSPAAAQTSPDGSAGPPDGNAAPRPPFPYGVFVADLVNAPRAQSAGFRVMASTVSWSRTQPSRGQYPFEQKDQYGRTAANDITNLVNAATSNGMKFGFRLIDPPQWAGGSPARVNPADLEDYAYHVVRYAHPSLAYFELFNEQNLASEWGGSPDPGAYARLIAAVARGVKRADPSIPVINAGPSQRTGGRDGNMEDVDWLDGFLQAGGASSVDALGVHAYLGGFDPTTDPSCQPLCFREVEQFRAVMDRDGDSQPMYITEFGALESAPVSLGQFDWMKLAPDQRAAYLVKALQMAQAYPGMAGATLFNLDYAAAGRPPSSEQYWFSLLDQARAGRLAYDRISQGRASGELP
jgi:polysaccharide biosynthesis protein PslG